MCFPVAYQSPCAARPFLSRHQSLTRSAANLVQGYPLRPELMESTFMLYEATGDDAYRRAGQALQQRLLARNKVECGFAGVSDVTTGAGGDASRPHPGSRKKIV